MAQNGKSASCGCGAEYLKDMPLPEVTFSTFVLSLYSSAMVLLGETEDPETGRVEARPHLARHTIDVLGMLKSKLDSGLNEEESRMLCDLLSQLRMKYVQKTR
ncbi:MAG: DUF1844 domain-containing protein [Desulfovibrionaceae bacterium]|jgi:hypothetical protein